MLQFIRSQVAGIFAKVLFFLLIASFAVWGIGDIFTGDRGGQAVIEVDDVRITGVEVEAQYRRARNAMSLPVDLPDGLIDTVIDQVVEGMVEESLFAAEANALGITVSDAMIAARIRETPAFRDQLGNFDPNAFQRALLNANLSEEGFVTILRTEMLRQQLAEAVLAGVRVPSPVTQALYAFRTEKRRAKATLIKTADQKVSAPTPGELDRFYSDRKVDFKAPEYRALTYLVLAPEDLADEIGVGAAAVEEEYQTRLDEFTTRARRTVEQALFDDQATANKVAAKIAEGVAFAAAVKAVTAGATEVLSLGQVVAQDLPESAQAPVFALTAGTVSAPIESAFGWHLFNVLEASEGSVKPLAEVRDQLKRDVQMARALDALFEMANGLEDLLAGGATVEEAARELNLAPSKINAVDAQGGLPVGAGGTAPTLGSQFLATAFQTEVGAQSDLIEDAGNRYFILRVDGVTPAAVQPLAVVKSEVTAAWRAESQRQAAEAIAARVEKAIAGGQDFDAAAAAENLSVTKITEFARTGEGLPSGLPADFAEVVFELTGDALGQSADDAQVAVVQLTGVVPAAPEKNQEAVDALAEQLTGEVARDALELFIAGLRQSRDVSIDRAAIDARIKSPHNDYNP